jgi:hypothetical protein
VPQYSLFFRGHIRSITPAVEQALIYADIGTNHDITPLTQNPAIRRALGHSWDGTEQGARALALMIDAMAAVIQSAHKAASSISMK